MNSAAKIKTGLVLAAAVYWAACTEQAAETSEVRAPGIADWGAVTETASYARYGLTKLSDYGFFEGDLRDLNPAERVFSYAVASPLFSDYAEKARFVFLPEGSAAEYDDRDVMKFPEGSVLIKNFGYAAEQIGADRDVLLETRLLIHGPEGWKALPYVWDTDQKEAYLDIAGGAREVTLPGHGTFRYSIPNMQQCKTCHDKNGKMSPIGPSARQLHHGTEGLSQLEAWHREGLLSGYPEGSPPAGAVAYSDTRHPLELRARAYLDANCAYCHRPEGSAKNSGLDLSVFAASEFALGIGKGPVAAGRGSGGLRHDIVPGNPDASIAVYRMESTEPAVMMPELGRSTVHDEGVTLIREWIAGLKEG